MPKGGTERTNAVDVRIGANLRAVRTAAGRPMKDLAAALGVSLTQISEYELGTDRIGAGALYVAAEVLGVRVSRFYADMTPAPGVAEDAAPFDRSGAPESSRATLLRALAAAPLTTQRRAIRAALKALETPRA